MSAGTETPRTTSAAGTGAVAASPRAGRAVEVAWAASGALVVMLLALVPLVRAPRYYFNDDTQIGAYGIWFRIGELLREGGFSFLETDTWAAGNYFVEGQWGLLNPVVLLIGFLAWVITPDLLGAARWTRDRLRPTRGATAPSG